MLKFKQGLVETKDVNFFSILVQGCSELYLGEARLRNTVLERCQEKVRVEVGRSVSQGATSRLGGDFAASLGH